MLIQVSFGGTPIGAVNDVQLATTGFNFVNLPFTPTNDTGTLTFQTTVTGDMSAYFDAVNIVQRDAGNAVIANPSFEASGPPTDTTGNPPSADSGEVIKPAAMAGWVWDTNQTGTYGISLAGGAYADNGAVPALVNRTPVEEVGIYLSTSTINAMMLPGDAMNFAQQTHQYAVWGWGTALSELHYQYRIVPEWKLNDSGLLQGLKVLIIPNAKAFEPADVATLQTWVAAGGCLLVTGDSGSLLGESGNFAPANTLVLAPLTGVASFNVPPALRTNFLGSGAVYYYGGNPGYVYYNATAANRAA